MAFSLDEIVGFTGGRLVNGAVLGAAASSIRVSRPAALKAAGREDVAFFFSRSYQNELPLGDPGILLTGDEFVVPLEAAGLPLWRKTAVVACRDPYYAMAVLSERFASGLSSVAHLPGARNSEITGTARAEARVHPSAIVDPSVVLGPGASVGAGCVIERGTRIGSGTLLYPGCYIGESCVIGRDCVLFPKVTLYEWTELGERVRIHAGAVLGADGFGYAPKREGGRITGHQKIFHLGCVTVGDDAEIGANTCIDRSTFGETRIERSAKIDNLVQIGHNVRIGEGAVLCGGVCVAGSASIGRFATIGGMTGVTNQVEVGDGAQVGALTLVTKDVPAGGTAVGNPQREYREHFRAHAHLSKLLSERVRPSKGEGKK